MNKEWTGKYWNTRFIEYKETWYSRKDYEEYFVKHFALHEVHYDEMDNPIAWTSEPVDMRFQDYDDIKVTMKHMKDALKRTVLKIKDNKLIDTGKLVKDYKEKDLTNYDVDKELSKYPNETLEDIIEKESEENVFKEGNKES